jgi:hypothetical protein
MKKNTLQTILAFVLLMGISLGSQAVNVYLKTDKPRTAAINNAERNLANLLTNIDAAQRSRNNVSMRGVGMSDFSKKSLARLWAVTPFHCESKIQSAGLERRLWVLRNGTMMVRDIPLTITPLDGGYGMNEYQEATVEFDRNGTITDFRFTFNAQAAGINLEEGGEEVQSWEEQYVILQTLERFRTAYNMKDLATIEAMFSDDALIITGNVVQRRKPGDRGGATYDVQFNRQNKQQYISNLRRCFARNSWINVTFDLDEDYLAQQTGNPNVSCISRSTKDGTKYGVRLRQTWKSSTYSDVGLLFLLFEFPADGSDPIIHVRTWQPESAGGKRLGYRDDISTLGGFGF